MNKPEGRANTGAPFKIVTVAVICTGVVGTASARDIDFSFSGRMYHETTRNSYGTYSHIERWSFPTFESESKQENIESDYIRTTVNDHGFVAETYSYGNFDRDPHFNYYHIERGRGSLQGTFTVNRPGHYYLDATTFHESNNPDPAVVHKLWNPQGFMIFSHYVSYENHERRFLTAGTYTYLAAYSTPYTPTSSIYEPAYNEQRLRLSVQAVPEPGTLLALGAGFALLGRKRVR